jgi:hypothetical protein
MRTPAAAAELRDKRGDQQVTFDDIADHLVDFAERHPELDAVTADIAEFLAVVEDVEHDHSEDEDTGGIAPA